VVLPTFRTAHRACCFSCGASLVSYPACGLFSSRCHLAFGLVALTQLAVMLRASIPSLRSTHICLAFIGWALGILQSGVKPHRFPTFGGALGPVIVVVPFVWTRYSASEQGSSRSLNILQSGAAGRRATLSEATEDCAVRRGLSLNRTGQSRDCLSRRRYLTCLLA